MVLAPQKYIYTQTNSIIDDSWIGTPIDSWIFSQKSPTTPKKSRLKSPDSFLVVDDSWIGNFTQRASHTSIPPKKLGTQTNETPN